MPVEYQHASAEVLAIARDFGIQLKRKPVDRVYVYAMRLLTPLGDETQTYGKMLDGEIGIRPFNTQNFRTHFAAPVEIDLTEHYDPRELRDLSYASGLSDVAVRGLVKNAGIAGEDGKLKPGINRDRFAMCIGSGAGATLEFIDAYLQIHSAKDENGNPDPLAGSKKVDGRIGRRAFPQDVVARPSISIGAQGEGTSSTEACSTGLANLVLLYRSIRNGYSDAGIGGGVEGVLGRHPSGFGHHPEAVTGIFAKMNASSDEVEDPKNASKPFSLKPPGFVLGEGAGMLLLGNEQFGEENNLTPLAEVLGADKGMDAHHPTEPLPDRVARIILRSLIDEVRQDIYQMDLYAGHFTGTEVGDPKEIEALELALGRWTQVIPLQAPKYFLAHQLGAAGAITAYCAIEALRRQKVPGMDIRNLDPRFANHLIPQETMSIEADVATAAAFGFGGLGAAMTFGRV